jgi:phosphoribosylformimino-5-aminoimidazole carboxamide ribotide isomerase
MCSLVKGDYNTKIIYNENPLEVAKEFEAHGIEYLHLVDLDGAKSSQIVNYKILEQIASQTTLKIDFGGGLKSDADLKIAFDSGANQIQAEALLSRTELYSKNGFKNTVLIKLLVRTPTMKSSHIRVVGRIR